MTSETKSFIDFTDILGLEFECPNCSSTSLHSLAKIQQMPYACPNCNDPLIKERGTEDGILRRFVSSVKDSGNLKTAGRIRIQIRRENPVTADQPSTKSQ